MAYDIIQLPIDGAGKRLAARKSLAAGVSGEDLYFEANISQPDNAVGNKFVRIPLSAVPIGALAFASVDFQVTVAMIHLLLANVSSQAITVQVTSGDDTGLFSQTFVMPSGEVVNLPLYGMEMTGGLKWKASAVGVNGAASGLVA